MKQILNPFDNLNPFDKINPLDNLNPFDKINDLTVNEKFKKIVMNIKDKKTLLEIGKLLEKRLNELNNLELD